METTTEVGEGEGDSLTEHTTRTIKTYSNNKDSGKASTWTFACSVALQMLCGLKPMYSFHFLMLHIGAKKEKIWGASI